MVESDALTQRLGHVLADEVAAKVVEEKLRTVPQTPEGLYMQRELLPCVVEKQNTISQISLELERTRAALLNMRQKLDRIRCDRIHAGPTQQETSLKLLIEQVARDLAKQEEVLKEKNDQYEEFLNLCLGRHDSPSHDKSSPMELAEENLPLVQTQSLPVTQFSQDAYQKSYKWQQTSVSATSSPSHPAASPHLHKNPSSPELRRHHRETHAIASPPCGGASSFFLRRPAGSTSVPVIPRLYLGGEDDQNLARKSCVNEPWQLDVDSSSTDETSESSRYTGRSFLWRDQNGSASLPSLPKVSDLTANVRRPKRMEARSELESSPTGSRKAKAQGNAGRQRTLVRSTSRTNLANAQERGSSKKSSRTDVSRPRRPAESSAACVMETMLQSSEDECVDVKVVDEDESARVRVEKAQRNMESPIPTRERQRPLGSVSSSRSDQLMGNECCASPLESKALTTVHALRGHSSASAVMPCTSLTSTPVLRCATPLQTGSPPSYSQRCDQTSSSGTCSPLAPIQRSRSSCTTTRLMNGPALRVGSPIVSSKARLAVEGSSPIPPESSRRGVVRPAALRGSEGFRAFGTTGGSGEFGTIPFRRADRKSVV